MLYICIMIRNLNLKHSIMEKIVDLTMTRLFQLAEYVCCKCLLDKGEHTTSQSRPAAPTIRFSNDDKMVEGDLFQ